MTGIDWIIVFGFVVLLIAISIVTNRMTKSVAGFLSSERLAGRYLLTVAQSMAFLSAIGMVGQFESFYRNGIGGQWWGMLMMPVGIIVALSGWVVYRYRQTRAMTMAQFLEQRYSRKFRIFAGITAFFSGVLNCAVFPMVTANFMVYFLGIPPQYYHLIMFIMVASAVILAISGGQNTIMVTSFFQGIITSAACVAIVWFLVAHFGWDNIMTTLFNSENITAGGTIGPDWFHDAVARVIPDAGTYPDMIESARRREGVSMMNPFKQGGLPDFGISYFVMLTILMVVKTGVWQGGAGFMTAAKTPHEAKMGNILSSWRWLMITVGTVAFSIAAYVLIWNPAYSEIQAQIQTTVGEINDPNLQSQMFVPIVIRNMLPPGLLGLFAIFMIGAAVSTDDSAYHSWGSIFLQDVIMPFRKKPFTTEEHLKYLRWSIVLIGAISFIFSSFWTMKEFINMWFEITGAIYVGGASCAIIGGLYWKRGTTQGAWTGLISGSVISLAGIFIKQKWPEMMFPGTDIIVNGMHWAIVAVVVSFTLYFIVSLLTCKKPHNMDKLLHRGEYAVEEAQKEKEAKQAEQGEMPWILKVIGVTREFSKSDIVIYITMILWTTGWCLTFILGTIYNLATPITSERWMFWWTVMLGIQGVVSIGSAIWFTIGGAGDTVFLFKKLATLEVDESDDGTVVHDD
ncbi:sodium:solute symporter family protein [Verrucomicrobia bacterium S94]|nr:sodium:solute symporter family protein [Verrucomicrobia bacterium S94]